MPDIGFGEILVIVALALLVFGPDRLPKVAADAARTLRNVRKMASEARRDLVDASGISDDDEIAQTVRELRELDPRNVMKEPAPQRPASGRARGSRPARRPPPPSAGAEGAQTPGAAAPGAAGPGAAAPDGPVQSGNGVGGPAQAGTQHEGSSPALPPSATPGAAAADPDWT